MSKEKNRAKSISKELLQKVLVVYLTLAILITVGHMVVEYRNTTKDVLEELRTIQNSVRPGIAQALWDTNYNQLIRLVDGAIQLPMVSAAKVFNEHNELIYSSSNEFPPTNYSNEPLPILNPIDISNMFSDESAVAYKGRYVNEKVGKLILYTEKRIVLQRVQVGFFLLIFNAIIKTTALWFIFIWFSKRILTIPLFRFSSQVQAIEPSDIHNVRVNIANTKNNELTILENSFNTLLKSLENTQRALKEANKNLENKVAKKTADLRDSLSQLQQKHLELQQTQEQLLQTEKMASLGSLTAGIAHEINNPTNFSHAGAQDLKVELQAFERFLYSLLDDESESEFSPIFKAKMASLYEQLDSIMYGTQRIANIVSDLRTFSRTTTEEKQKIRLADNINAVINLIRSHYKERVTFTTNIPADIVLFCWPEKLNQVFMNILVNACHAAIEQHPEGNLIKPTVIIEASSSDNILYIRISDNGVGIPAELTSRVFEPFFTTKPVGSGTGLGLSISYNIIHEHGGEINLSSQEHTGTTFTIKLPISI